MSDKSLLEVDARIAKLQDEVAAGKGTPALQAEVQQLLERRGQILRSRTFLSQVEQQPS